MPPTHPPSSSDLDPSGGTREIRRNRSLQTLASVSRLLATLDFDEILESIVRAAIEMIGAARGFLFLVDDTDKLSMRVGRTAAGGEISFSGAAEISRSLVKQSLKERRIVYVRDVRSLVDLPPKSSIVQLGIGSALCLPMVLPRAETSGGGHRNYNPTRSVLGVIYTDRQQPGGPLSSEDEALFQSLGNLAAAAIVNAAIYKDAIVDGLTGLAHRRHFERTLAFEADRARRESRPLALLMIDLDFFKRVNDTHGHTTGDEVLRRTGKVLRAKIRSGDLAARYGGEEFAVVLPDCPLAQAVELAERIRSAAKQYFKTEGPVPVTMSVGVADWNSATDTAHEDLIRRADAALYASKHAGRDRVTPWSPSLATAPGQVDELRGIFSGEPSRDYQTMRALLQVLHEVGNDETPGDDRLKRVLALLREAVSGRRAELFKIDGIAVQPWLADGNEAREGCDAAAQAALDGKPPAGAWWTAVLKRGGNVLGVLAVAGEAEGKAPTRAQGLLLEALAPQVGMLVNEGRKELPS